MKLAFFAILFMVSSLAQAQCEVTRRSDGAAYQAEEVYRNANLEDGLLNIYLGFMKNSHGWHLIGTMGTTNTKDADIEPNLLLFSWESKKKSMVLNASNISTRHEGKLHVVFSVFDLTDEQVEVLRNAKIKSVLYGDLKTKGSQLITTMSGSLPKHQIECIKAAL